MFLGEALAFSVKALRANPVRSFLTGLGMVIGTASVILVVTISLTSRDYILEQIEGVGSNMIFAYYVSGRLVLYLYLNFFLAFLRSNVQLIVTRFRLVRRFQARASVRRIRISPSRRFPKHCLEKRPISRDRKSTRLNSSHRCISYAVFCLKKKTQKHKRTKIRKTHTQSSPLHYQSARD